MSFNFCFLLSSSLFLVFFLVSFYFCKSSSCQVTELITVVTIPFAAKWHTYMIFHTGWDYPYKSVATQVSLNSVMFPIVENSTPTGDQTSVASGRVQSFKKRDKGAVKTNFILVIKKCTGDCLAHLNVYHYISSNSMVWQSCEDQAPPASCWTSCHHVRRSSSHYNDGIWPEQ